MPSARVESTEGLIDLRSALVQFGERTQGALSSLRQEARRTLRWLQDEQPQYWQAELRRAFDQVASTRIAYETCRMRTIAGHRSACIEEKVAQQRAQRRLEYVQQQIDVTRQWGLRAADQANEFFGKLGPLERAIDYDVPRMIALLEQLLAAIDAYVENLPPDETLPSRSPLGQPAATGEDLNPPDVARPLSAGPLPEETES